jgi:penicillin-binding protein 1C
MVGPDRFVERLRAVGMDSVKESGDYYGFSLALGSADVTLLSLTNAYRTLANGGAWSATRLTPQPGNKPALPPHRAMSAAASYVIADILSDRAARAVAFGLDNPLETPFWSAVKTGTSKDMRDNWAIGFSSRYTVGVWVGNASGSPMHDVSGVSGAAPVWRDVMLHLHRRGAVRSEPPAVPAGAVVRELRYEPAIEPTRREVFMAGSERDVVRLATAGNVGGRFVRIASPVPGSIVALDPDIPLRNQRLQFSATAYGTGRWELDGKVIGVANRALSWFPMPGPHVLKLVSDKGELLDEAKFEVRGASLKTASR